MAGHLLIYWELDNFISIVPMGIGIPSTFTIFVGWNFADYRRAWYTRRSLCLEVPVARKYKIVDFDPDRDLGINIPNHDQELGDEA